MRRIFHAFVLCAVFAWLMPLGAFIKPAQEKTACGGNRAFHMCSMGKGPATSDYSLKTGFQNAPSNPAKPSAASGGSEFLYAGRRLDFPEKPVFFRPAHFFVDYVHFPEFPAPPPRILSSR